MNQRPEPTHFAARASDVAGDPNGPAPMERHDKRTPAGLQKRSGLLARRLLVIGLNVVTYVAMMAGLGVVLAAGGWTAIDVVIFIAFAFGAPWTVLGFWNAAIGLWLLHGVKDGVRRVAPFAADGEGDAPITVRTAIFMTLRNEDPARAIFRLRTVKDSVDATGFGLSLIHI